MISRSKIAAYLAQRSLPRSGFVLTLKRKPIGWEAELPPPSKVEPGVAAVEVENMIEHRAYGGDAFRGANEWVMQ